MIEFHDTFITTSYDILCDIAKCWDLHSIVWDEDTKEVDKEWEDLWMYRIECNILYPNDILFWVMNQISNHV